MYRLFTFYIQKYVYIFINFSYNNNLLLKYYNTETRGIYIIYV